MHLDVAPPVGAVCARALGEVDLFVGENVYEIYHLREVALYRRQLSGNIPGAHTPSHAYGSG